MGRSGDGRKPRRNLTTKKLVCIGREEQVDKEVYPWEGNSVGVLQKSKTQNDGSGEVEVTWRILW